MRADSLYIHIPFCVKKCSYCAFSSQEHHAGAVQAWLCAFSEEFDHRAAHMAPSTIYVGGGTPTSLTLSELESFFRVLSQLDLSAVQEFTFEANPGTIDMEKLMFLHEQGVNRLSLGVQSFNDDCLKLLGRIHSSRQAKVSLIQAREAGFDNISIDLINCLPGQNPDMWLQDLEEAVKLRPEHMSCYGLTFEEGTPLDERRQQGELSLVSEEDARAMFDITAAFLAHHGLKRYEISSFCLPGKESRHNLNYWQGGDYVGLGPSAHSYVDELRFSNCEDLSDYVRRIAQEGTARDWEEHLPSDKRARERAVIALRMTEGFNVEGFESETGFRVNDLFGFELRRLLRDGWLEEFEGHIRLSQKAFPVADSVLSELV